ncbi:MAG: hypothetical protein OJF49_004115 [Ktedonobacterales bacterium]|jgi:hypothetical protein|nr:MAG: hypothetical protein OJF49_004115 [Ktedonobacterales bacterium]
MEPLSTITPPPIQKAALHLYQLYDVADTINLDRAREVSSAPSARVRPVASRGGNIEIAQLPLELSMGDYTVPIGERHLRAYLSARIYDLGIFALRLVLPLDDPLTWDDLTDLMAHVQNVPSSVMGVFETNCDVLRKMLAPAILKPNVTTRTEDYAILLVEQLAPGAPASLLGKSPTLLRAALGERRPLSASAQSLATSLSYYEDDLILLTWSAAIVIEPDAIARDDAALLLEFANVELLSFRTYDDQVERDLMHIAPRIQQRRRPIVSSLGSTGAFLHEIHALITDITQTSARVENALKVSEDVYWNRVYTAALATLRVNVWRASIAETLQVLRETASMLHDDSHAAWATLLEILVIVLIAVELVVALIGPH